MPHIVARDRSKLTHGGNPKTHEPLLHLDERDDYLCCCFAAAQSCLVELSCIKCALLLQAAHHGKHASYPPTR